MAYLAPVRAPLPSHRSPMAAAGVLAVAARVFHSFEPHCAQDQKGRIASALSATPAHGSHERTIERRTRCPPTLRASEPEDHDGRVVGRACPFLCDVLLGWERGVGDGPTYRPQSSQMRECEDRRPGDMSERKGKAQGVETGPRRAAVWVG